MTIKEEPAQVPSGIQPENRRRAALRRIGLNALAVLAGSALVGDVLALPKPPRPPGPGPRPPVDLQALRGKKLSTLQKSQLQAINLTRRAPATTNIAQLGLTDDAVAKLTEPAKQLTKKDLEALGRADLSNPKVGALTVDDIASIRTAFSTGYRPGGGMGGGVAAADVSCCCCTPCCCAAAVTPSLRLAA